MADKLSGHTWNSPGPQETTGVMSLAWLQKFGYVEYMVILGIVLYSVVFIFPLLLSFYYSLTDLNPLYSATHFIGLDNYRDMLEDTRFGTSLVVTIKMGIFIALGANIGGLVVALLLNHRGAFYSSLRTIFFIPQVLSAVIVSFIWSIILTDRGILNTVLVNMGLRETRIAWLGDPHLAVGSLITVVTWQLIGFCTVIYLAALQGIPKDYYDAAKIDGANRRQQFQHITFPLISPGITINVTLLLIMVFKLYDQVAVLTNGGPGGATETLSYYIIRLGFTANQTGYASALAVILFLTIAAASGIVVTSLRRREVEF